jgi:integrase
MVAHCETTPDLRWLADVIVALATTGLRIGELVDLRWSDVDLVRGVLSVRDNRHSARHRAVGGIRTNKGRRTRRVPVHTRLRAVLEKLPRRPDGRVFGGPRGGRLKADTVLLVLKRDVLGPLKGRFPTPKDDLGFDCRLHSFRHFFVSEAFLGGASEGEVREWVGHTESRIVERYRHLRNEDARRKMDGIDFLGDAKDDQTKENDAGSTTRNKETDEKEKDEKKDDAGAAGDGGGQDDDRRDEEKE